MRAWPTDQRLRRVGFRHGTDAELAAMHAVVSEVDAERRPGHKPQPLASYIAFARSLPSRFDDHTWVVERVADGLPVAYAACWSNAAGDERVMEADICVRRDGRRQGTGAYLLRVISEVTLGEGRISLVWSTYSAVSAGEAFSRRFGARAARVNRTSEVCLTDVDWAMVRAWVHAGERRSRGYPLEVIEGPYPPERYHDAVLLHHIMQTAPRDELDAEPVLLGADDIGEHNSHLAEAGRQQWAIFVRDPSGACVGGTEVTFEPWQPSVAFQQNTGLDPRHRGLGLAKWAKAAMLERIRVERPQVEQVQTANAFSNAAMLAINDSLGFRVTETRTDWQADAGSLHRALAHLS